MNIKKYSMTVIAVGLFFATISTYTMDNFGTSLRAGYVTGLMPVIGQYGLRMGLGSIINDEALQGIDGLLLGHSAGLATYLTALFFTYRHFGKRVCAVASVAIPAVVIAAIAAAKK
jgi:hypothetical protein